MQRTTACRNCNGSVLAESAAGMWLVISGMILGTLLLLNVGGYIYYKEKLGFIADRTATYACTLPVNATRNSLAIAAANQNLSSMGFDPARTTIDVSDLTITGRPAVKVTLTCSLSTLLSSNFSSVIPSLITISDTAVSSQREWYFGDCSFLGPNGQRFTSPMANSNGNVPNDGLPAWHVTLLGMARTR